MTSDQAGDVRADPPVPEGQGREVPAQREDIASSGMSPNRVVAGRYRLLDPLGEGGMGTVWRAHDEVPHREVTVKSGLRPRAAQRQGGASVHAAGARIGAEVLAALQAAHEAGVPHRSRIRPDPAQRARLAEIRDNLIARIAEAETEGA